METKEQYTTIFHLSNYSVRHSIVLPSKFSDYDYDDINPDRRFLSEIFHKLDFSDPIIGIQQCSILFTSDTSYKLRDALYHMNDNLGLDNNDATKRAPVLATINDVYVNSFINKPSYMSLVRDLNKVIMSIVSQYHYAREVFKISLDETDCITLSSILEASDQYTLIYDDWLE